MTIEEVRLFLQLVGRDPVIVAVQQRDVFAAGCMDAARDDSIAANVLVRKQQADALGILLLIRDDGLARAIRRTILAHEDFDVEARALRERASSACVTKRAWLYVITSTVTFGIGERSRLAQGSESGAQAGLQPERAQPRRQKPQQEGRTSAARSRQAMPP